MAFWLDDAIFHYGQWVESKLGERNKKGKPRYKLWQVLGEKPPAKEASLADLSSLI